MIWTGRQSRWREPLDPEIPLAWEPLGPGLDRCAELASAWSGTVYRAATPRRANAVDLISGRGSFLHGGRWNLPGLFPVVYAACQARTSLEEVLAQNRFHGLPEEESLPIVVTALRVRLDRVLDLLDPRIGLILQVSTEQMVAESHRELNARGQEAKTQAIGRLAYKFKYQGLFVPSAAHPGGTNLVLFPDYLRDPESLVIVNADRLPEPQMV